MVWGLVVEPSDIPGLTAAAGLLGFGLWLLYLDPTSRVNRVFAVFMFLRAGFLASVRLGEFIYSTGGRMAPYFAIAAPFAAAYFCIAYRDTFHRQPKPWPTPKQAFPFLVGAAVVMELAYFVEHEWFFSGWLQLAIHSLWATLALCGYMFVREIGRPENPQPTNRALYYAGLGLLVECTYTMTWFLTETATEIAIGAPWSASYLHPILILAHAMWAGVLVLVWFAFARIRSLKEELPGRHATAFAVLILAATLTAVPTAMLFAIALVTRNGTSEFWIGIHFIVGAIWILVGLGLSVYSVLRHQLFNINWKMHIAVRGTTLAGIFFALLFVLSEGVQALFADFFSTQTGVIRNAGAILSVVGAGIVVFALHPVQRFAERVASSTVPNSRPVSEMAHPDRIRLYREQAEVAWLDGQLQRKERLLLDGLRERLGLTVDEASKIEQKAMNASGVFGFQNRTLPAQRPRRPRGRVAKS